jgi:putative transcriptional regulator
MPKAYFRIKELLEERGKTQIWLAEKLGVGTVTISRYVNNHRQPSMETLAEIAKALGVKVKDLIND